MPPESSPEDKIVVDAKTPEAESSAADEGAKKPDSMLDAVKAALSTEDQGEESPTSKEEEGKDEATTTESSKPEDEEPPFHKHPRWQEMKARNKELEAKAADFESVKTKADSYDAISGFIEKNGLTNEEVDTGFEIMRLMKQDPHKALEQLQPVYESLLNAVGKGALPENLQQQVESGAVSEDVARQLATTTAQRDLVERQLAEAKARDEKAAEEDRVARETELRGKITSAVAAWDSQWKSSDPDFSKKYPLVKAKVIELISSRGVPRSPEEAIKLAEDAKRGVDEHLKSIMPKRDPARVITGGSSGPTMSAPKSLLEAVSQAARGG